MVFDRLLQGVLQRRRGDTLPRGLVAELVESFLAKEDLRADGETPPLDESWCTRSDRLASLSWSLSSGMLRLVMSDSAALEQLLAEQKDDRIPNRPVPPEDLRSSVARLRSQLLPPHLQRRWDSHQKDVSRLFPSRSPSSSCCVISSRWYCAWCLAGGPLGAAPADFGEHLLGWRSRSSQPPPRSRLCPDSWRVSLARLSSL